MLLPFLLLDRVARTVVRVLYATAGYQYDLPIAGAAAVAAKQAIGAIWDDLVHRLSQDLANKSLLGLTKSGNSIQQRKNQKPNPKFTIRLDWGEEKE